MKGFTIIDLDRPTERVPEQPNCIVLYLAGGRALAGKRLAIVNYLLDSDQLWTIYKDSEEAVRRFRWYSKHQQGETCFLCVYKGLEGLQIVDWYGGGDEHGADKCRKHLEHVGLLTGRHTIPSEM